MLGMERVDAMRRMSCSSGDCSWSGPLFFPIEVPCNERVERFRIWFKSARGGSVKPHQGVEVETVERQRFFIEFLNNGPFSSMVERELCISVTTPRRVDGFLTKWISAKNSRTVEQLRDGAAQVCLVEGTGLVMDCWEFVDLIWALLKSP